MKNCAAFQAQLASIMEVLAKAAVAEISKLVEDGSVVLRLEVSRSHKEIDCLKRKLQQVESELRTAQEAATHDNRSIGVQVEDQFGEGAVVGEEIAEKSHPFKQKHCEEDSGAQSCNTRPVFGFTVKAEQEEEHIAQRLNQAGCEHSTGRFNTLGSEYGMYERDIQKWNSFTQGNCNIEINDPVCSNATELCSQGLTVNSPLQRTPATLEVSGSTLFLESDFQVVDGDVVKEEAGGQCLYSEESRSDIGDTQQTGFRPPPVLMNDDLTSQLWQPLQQPSDWQTGVTDDITNPVSNKSKKARIHWKTGPGDKPYGCTQCEKSFCRFIDLERHRRIHTGEKPFGCAQCGKRFSLRGNLITHERVHTGNKPFGCVHCGKRFAQGSNLRAHHRIHTGERPYHCTQCGKRFTQLSALKTHLKVHSRNELLQLGMNCM